LKNGENFSYLLIGWLEFNANFCNIWVISWRFITWNRAYFF